jgi:hypothetical protein
VPTGSWNCSPPRTGTAEPIAELQEPGGVRNVPNTALAWASYLKLQGIDPPDKGRCVVGQEIEQNRPQPRILTEDTAALRDRAQPAGSGGKARSLGLGRTEAGPAKWVVPAWEVLATDRGGWRAGLKRPKVNESEVGACFIYLRFAFLVAARLSVLAPVRPEPLVAYVLHFPLPRRMSAWSRCTYCGCCCCCCCCCRCLRLRYRLCSCCCLRKTPSDRELLGLARCCTRWPYRLYCCAHRLRRHCGYCRCRRCCQSRRRSHGPPCLIHCACRSHYCVPIGELWPAHTGLFCGSQAVSSLFGMRAVGIRHTCPSHRSCRNNNNSKRLGHQIADRPGS